MRSIKAMALFIGIVLVMSLGSAAASTTIRYDWKWLGEMLMNISGEVAQIKEKTIENNKILLETQEKLNEDIYPGIVESRAILDRIIEKEETAWNKLIEIDEKADLQYDQLIESQAKFGDADDSILEELQSQKEEIMGMKADIGGMLSQISTNVQPSLVAIHEEITELRGEIGDSKGVIDLLQELEEEMLKLDSDIVNMKEIDDDRYAAINGRLDEIVENDRSAEGKADMIKDDIANMRDYLEGDIKAILENIDTTTAETKESVDEANEKLEAISNYLQYTVYPEIEASRQRLDEIMASQKTAWNDIVYIKNKVDENGKEIAANKEAVSSMGKDVAEQLYANEITVKQMDTKVSDMVDELSSGVMERFDDFNADIMGIKAKLNDIKDDTEGIGASQEEILESLAELESDMKSVDLDLDSISRYTSSLFGLLDCGNTDSVMCDKLDELSDSVSKVNMDTEELKEGQITIKNYVDTLENADVQINDKLDYLRNSFNCELAVPNDVCFRLTLIENYLGNLADDSGAIREYADTLDDIKLDLEGKIDTVLLKADEAKLETESIKQAVNDMRYVTDESFDAVNIKLDLVGAEVREITTSGIKLDFDTFLLLEDILDAVDGANIKIGDMGSYMKGELVEEIEEIVEEEGEEIKEAIENNTEEVIEAVEENTEEVIEEINESTEEILGAVEDVQETVVEESEEIQETVEEAKEEVVEKIEYEAEKTRDEIVSEIRAGTDIITAGLNENSGKLDGILQNWGINDVSNMMEKLEKNMEGIADLYDMLAAYNDTEKQRYEESQGVINSIKEWTGLFDNTAENNYNNVMGKVDELDDKLKETLELNSEIYESVAEYGEDDLVYDDIAELITKNAQILRIVEGLNLTTSEIMDKVSAMETSLESVGSEIDSMKLGWNADSEEKILGRLNIIDTKMGYLNVSEDIAGLTELVGEIEEELGFSGKSTDVYGLMMDLDSRIVNAESRIRVSMETEGLETRELLEDKITERSNEIISSINENQIMLYELLNKMDEFDAADIGMIVEENRDKLIELRSWLAEFNDTEEMRYSESKKMKEKLLNLIGLKNTTENRRHAEIVQKLGDMGANIDSVEDIANMMLTEVETSDAELYDELVDLIDELSGVLGEAGMHTNANEIRLFKGKNYITMTVQPANNSIEDVFSGIRNSLKRVEFYDDTGKEWLVFNPDAPFGNTLEDVYAGRSYWITMKGDAVLTIN